MAMYLRKLRDIFCPRYHASNVSILKKLLEYFNQNSTNHCILYELRKIYLCHGAVHFINNIRNNLLNHKRILFSSFISNRCLPVARYRHRERLTRDCIAIREKQRMSVFTLQNFMQRNSGNLSVIVVMKFW